MSNEPIIAALPRRNAQAVEQALREMEKRLNDAAQLVQTLHRTVSQLSQRLATMETRMSLQIVQQFSNGPTVRD